MTAAPMATDKPIDVFFCTGEKSGDVLAAAVHGELLKLRADGVRAAGLAGVHCTQVGVENIFDRPDLATVEFSVATYDDWDAIYRYLLRDLNERPARVFVGVTHHMFNLALAPELPEQTYKMLVGPPEIWGWRLNWLGVGLANVFRPLTWVRWFKDSVRPAMRRVYVVATSMCTVADRGKLPLKHFDKVVCLTPLNYDTYGRASERMGRGIVRRQASESRLQDSDGGATRGADGRATRIEPSLRCAKGCHTGGQGARAAGAEVVFAGHSAALLRRDGYMPRVEAFRRRHGIADGAHILTILPGSRPGSVRRVLPTIMEAVVEILNRYPGLHCLVSAADETVQPYIESQLAAGRERITRPQRLGVCGEDTRLLLCAGSHAIMSSGTVTLEAACLGARGTVVYDLGRLTKVLFALFCRRMRFGPEKHLAPFALPNALYAWLERPKEQWPYDEFTLKKRYFNAANVVRSVAGSLDAIPAEYDIEAPPTLAGDMIETIREAFTPPGGDCHRFIAEHIAAAIDGIMSPDTPS